MTSPLLSIPSLMPTLGVSYEIFIFIKASLTDMFLLLKAEVLPYFIICSRSLQVGNIGIIRLLGTQSLPKSCLLSPDMHMYTSGVRTK